MLKAWGVELIESLELEEIMLQWRILIEGIVW